jgi:hypothetical protein
MDERLRVLEVIEATTAGAKKHVLSMGLINCAVN